MRTENITGVSILGALARHERELLEAVQRAHMTGDLLIQQARQEAQEALSRQEEGTARQIAERRRQALEAREAVRRAILDEAEGKLGGVRDSVQRIASQVVEDLAVLVLPAVPARGGRS